MQESKELSAELLALTHQIELNKSGWWNQTIQQLILSIFFIKNKPISSEEIKEHLLSWYKLDLSKRIVENTITEFQVQIVKNNNKYSLANKTRNNLTRLINETKAAESEAQNHFLETADGLGITENHQALWGSFKNEYLIPLIKHIGAQTYHLINGQETEKGNSILLNFLRPFSDYNQSKIKELAASFFDPSHNKTKNYVIRLLHARLCIDAGGLTESQLKEINNNRDFHWRLYVDTNFLFSLLGFHKNPSNEVALELREIAKQLNTTPRVSFLVTPETLREAITVLEHEKSKSTRFYRKSVFADAASELHISGITGRIIEDKAKGKFKGSPDQWIDFRINNLHSIVQQGGIEIINKTADNPEPDDSIRGDIETFYSILTNYDDDKTRTEEVVTHDVRLWRFVKEKRPLETDQFSKNNDWIITLDKNLIKFDQLKRGKSQSNIPVCLAPEETIHLLQFWIPRTEAFEEAILGSLRHPFLFHDFDVAAEQTTIRILEGISNYENTDDMSKEMIVQVAMDEALRAAIEKTSEPEEEEQLIRDALILEKSAENKLLTEKLALLEKEKNLDLEREKGLRTKAEEELKAVKKRTEEQQDIAQTLKDEKNLRKQAEERLNFLRNRNKHILAFIPIILWFIVDYIFEINLVKCIWKQSSHTIQTLIGFILGLVSWTLIQPCKSASIKWVVGIICGILGTVLGAIIR